MLYFPHAVSFATCSYTLIGFYDAHKFTTPFFFVYFLLCLVPGSPTLPGALTFCMAYACPGELTWHTLLSHRLGLIRCYRCFFASFTLDILSLSPVCAFRVCCRRVIVCYIVSSPTLGPSTFHLPPLSPLFPSFPLFLCPLLIKMF